MVKTEEQKKGSKRKGKKSVTTMSEKEAEEFFSTMVDIEENAYEQTMHVVSLKGFIKGRIHY